MAFSRACTTGSAPDATVWARDLTIKGILDTSVAREGDLFAGAKVYHFVAGVNSAEFLTPIRLGPGRTLLVARRDSAGTWVYSDTVRLTLGFRLRPEASLSATVLNQDVQLRAEILENPDSSRLSFTWSLDPMNPGSLALTPTGDTSATVGISPGAPPGGILFQSHYH